MQFVYSSEVNYYFLFSSLFLFICLKTYTWVCFCQSLSFWIDKESFIFKTSYLIFLGETDRQCRVGFPEDFGTWFLLFICLFFYGVAIFWVSLFYEINWMCKAFSCYCWLSLSTSLLVLYSIYIPVLDFHNFCLESKENFWVFFFVYVLFSWFWLFKHSNLL